MSTPLHSTTIDCLGHRFELFHHDPDDHIFRHIRASGCFYELGLLRSLRRLLEPDDRVVDVGANIGNHSIFFAGVCGCRVLAIEPVDEAFALLEHNVRANGLGDRITARKVALGEAAGRATAQASAAEHNLGATAVTLDERGPIRVMRLDDLSLEGVPRLVKIDAEGMELAILKGAHATLEASALMVCVEAKEPAEFEGIFDLMAGHGFLVGEVHNYSPTHLFVRAQPGADHEVVRLLSRFAGDSYLRWQRARKELLEQVGDLRGRIAKLERQQDRSGGSRGVALPAPSWEHGLAAAIEQTLRAGVSGPAGGGAVRAALRTALRAAVAQAMMAAEPAGRPDEALPARVAPSGGDVDQVVDAVLAEPALAALLDQLGSDPVRAPGDSATGGGEPAR